MYSPTYGDVPGSPFSPFAPPTLETVCRGSHARSSVLEYDICRDPKLTTGKSSPISPASSPFLSVLPEPICPVLPKPQHFNESSFKIAHVCP